MSSNEGRLPYLHPNPRSQQITRKDAVDVFIEEAVDKRGVGQDPYYGSNAVGGAAWHAVQMARQERERGD